MAHPAGQPNFDIGGLVQKSWQVIQRNALVLVLALIVSCIISMVAAIIAGIIAGRLAGIGVALVQGPLALGYCGIALAAARGGAPQFPALFEGFNRYVPAFLASLAISAPSLIASIAGSFLFSVLMIPVSLVFAFLFGLTFFFMADKKQDFWPAMQSSMQTVMNALGPWLILYIVIFVMNFIGAIPCGLGLLVTVPMGTIMLALAYERVGGGISAAPGQADYQA
jgi:uncharacterized membrane protein